MAIIFNEVLGREENVMEPVEPGNEPKPLTQEIVINDKLEEGDE